MKRVGDRLGKYQLERALGEGGAGAVFLARDLQLGRPVALKLLHEHFAQDEGMAARFKVEAEAMARMNHPNVATVHDLVSDGGDWAIVMELVENGESLATLLQREGRLDPLRVMRLGADAAAGLAHAHGKGIIHRDVKPANLLVTRDGQTERVKVTDFGIARLVGAHARTQRNVTLGTLYYLSPEQAQSSHVDARADLYSLGVSLYECVVGHVPFRYPSAPQLLHAHVHETPAAPSSLGIALPPAFEALLGQLLSKNPDERPASADHLSRSLSDALRALQAPHYATPSFSSPPLPVTREVASLAHEIQAPRADRALLDRETRQGLWISAGVILFAACLCVGGIVLSCLVTH